MTRLLAALLASAAFPAFAGFEERGRAGSSSPVDAAIARIKALPEPELKSMYRRCARASVRGRLAGSEIALCSVAYQHLLDQHFAGDFRAFLEWRRAPEPASSASELPPP